MLRDDAIKKGLIQPGKSDTVMINDIQEIKQSTSKEIQDPIIEQKSTSEKPAESKSQVKRRGRKPAVKN